MDGIRRSVRLAVGATLLLAFALVVAMLPRGAPPTPLPIEGKGGGPFALPTAAGVTEASWQGTPVLVFLVPAERLEGVDQQRGAGEATPSATVPGQPGLRLFALSAKSTYLGCTVGLQAELGASLDIEDYDLDGLRDGRVLDPCHHGQWDPYHRGVPVAGPAPERLAVLDASVQDGRLVATGFDGPVGPAPR
ncbi:MAG: hypothetical protein QOD77_410 [Thermoplasmata archaeon]|jgi:Rieske Fe-S protein|nr:hypothetical protein [Thermoplasmata archaeon]